MRDLIKYDHKQSANIFRRCVDLYVMITDLTNRLYESIVHGWRLIVIVFCVWIFFYSVRCFGAHGSTACICTLHKSIEWVDKYFAQTHIETDRNGMEPNKHGQAARNQISKQRTYII